MKQWLTSLFGRGSAKPKSLVLYTRDGCCLCDDAKEILLKHISGTDLTLTEIDIDRDESLKKEYDCCVPVVAIDGKVRFRGRVNEPLLRRLLRRRSATAD